MKNKWTPAVITYRYIIQGNSVDGTAWRTEGRVEATAPGAFMDAIDKAMRKGFMDLTEGKAVYGNPGQGCSGPYRMTLLNFSEVGKEGTWFNRHERFGDCKPNEVYIGMGAFAEFTDRQVVRLRNEHGEMLIDHDSISILHGALTEWKEKNK
jgi:hypothetical protein